MTNTLEATKMQTLWCQNGKHEWAKPSGRGRPPHHCPEHKPAPGPKLAPEERVQRRVEGKQAKREEAARRQAERQAQEIQRAATQLPDALEEYFSSLDRAMKASTENFAREMGKCDRLQDTVLSLSRLARL
jgi:hypothetical protein